MAGGAGFFSVPPEKVVQIQMRSFCLEHGKPDPRPTATYRLVRLETYTKNPVLQELIESAGTGKIDRQVAQAAIWHITDNMSWEELARKHVEQLGGADPEPYFTRGQLMGAQQFVAEAKGRAKTRKVEEGGSRVREEKKL